jgi:copper transport protein
VRFASGRAGGRRLGRLVPLVAVAALLAGAGLAGTLARPAAVAAHALLRGASPAAGATLGTAPAEVRLTFSETPDIRLTSIKVLDTGGADHASGPVEAVADPTASARVPVGALRDGVYTVSWRTVSAVDGHISAGSFVFGVGVSPPSGPQQPASVGQSGSPPAIVARWVLYLGLIALVGAAFVALAVASLPSIRTAMTGDLLGVAAAGWGLTALGTFGVIGVQWVETGAPIETLLGTSVGLAAVIRLVALGAVAASVAALAAVPRFGGRSGWLLVGATASAALIADVALGHAAAGEAGIFQIAVQATHGLAAGAWVGGLAALLVSLRSCPAGERLAAARRFSTWAATSLVIVAATGAVRAVQEVQTIEALTTTDFGRTVLAKTALLLAIAALGALNRVVSLRSAERLVVRLRRVGAVEVVLAVAVLGASALLVNLTPPASAGGQQAATPPPIVARGSDFGTSVKARLIATPGTPGQNRFDLAIVDYDTGEPIDATAVELGFELSGRPDIARSTLDLERTDAGRFGATGSNLSIDGIWIVTATVTTAGAAVEVPMLAVTSIAPQHVDSLVTPGLPTIHTIQLGALGSAQLYLDPGTAGQNDMHITYFDPAGAALPVDAAAIAVVAGDAETQLPTVRRLDVGHFVATVDVPAGSLAVDVVSPAPAGSTESQLHVHLTIEVTP